MVYILNSPVLSGYGRWDYLGPIDLDAARRLAVNAISAVGHLGTAQHIGRLLDMPVACDRRKVEMRPGDHALVFQLLRRLPEGEVLSLDALTTESYEFGVLRRIE